jgi:hypothetical protein
MTLCNYQILEYAWSELQSEGRPFAIVLHLDAGDPSSLRGFVLKNWERMLPNLSTVEASSIREFLDDLRFYSREDAESSKAYFSALGSLSTGPVRNLVSGACAVDDLGDVCALFFERNDGCSTWEEHFDGVS